MRGFEQHYSFLIEGAFMVIAVLMFVCPLHKKENNRMWIFLWLAVDLLILIFLTCYAPSGFPFYLITQGVITLLLFVLLYQLVWEDGKSVLYLAVWCSMIAHFIYDFWHVTVLLFFAEDQIPAPLLAISLIGLYLVSFWLLSATLVRIMPQRGEYRIGPRQLFAALGLYVILLLLHYLVIFQETAESRTLYYSSLLLTEVYCISMLYMQSELFKKGALEKELLTMNLLWQQEKQQYEIARENIDLINHKCHDLKHQIRALRQMDTNEQSKEQYLSQLEKSVQIYDSIVKTGNDVLDTILTDKSLHCEREGIRINCVVDGSRMGFIDPVDLYSILGNALDNAIEEVEQFSQKEKRIIDISIHVQGNFLIFLISNPLETQPVFARGLPQTTKGNNGYHGFGLPSVKHCVKQYNGHLSVDAREGRFSLKIMIPIPATT
jgi:signal transduction histidine kinase